MIDPMQKIKKVRAEAAHEDEDEDEDEEEDDEEEKQKDEDDDDMTKGYVKMKHDTSIRKWKV